MSEAACVELSTVVNGHGAITAMTNKADYIG